MSLRNKGDIIIDGILSAKEDGEIIDEVYRQFPDADTKQNSINFYRSLINLRESEVQTKRRFMYDAYLRGKSSSEIHKLVNNVYLDQKSSEKYVTNFVSYMKQIDRRIEHRK